MEVSTIWSLEERHTGHQLMIPDTGRKMGLELKEYKEKTNSYGSKIWSFSQDCK